MIGCVTPPIILLVGAGFLVAPLPLSPGHDEIQKQGEGPTAAQDVTDRQLHREEGFMVPAVTALTSVPQPDVVAGHAEGVESTSKMGQSATDSLFHQSQAIKASLWSSSSVVEGVSANDSEAQLGSDATSTLVKAMSQHAREGPVAHMGEGEGHPGRPIPEKMESGPQGTTPGQTSPERAPHDRSLSRGEHLSGGFPALLEPGWEAASVTTVVEITPGLKRALSPRSPSMAPMGPQAEGPGEGLKTSEEVGPKGRLDRETPATSNPDRKHTALLGGVIETPSSSGPDTLSPLTPNPSPEWSTMGDTLLQPSSPKEPGAPAPTPTEQPHDGYHPLTGGALRQDGVGAQGSTHSLTTPEMSSTSLSTSVRELDDPPSEDMVLGLDQDGTLSPEHLPLLFEPLDDVTPEAMATALPGGSLLASQPSNGMGPEAELVEMVTADADHSPSEDPLAALPDSPSLPWQMSGSESSDSVSSSVLPSFTVPPSGPPARTANPEERNMTDTATEGHLISNETPPPSTTGHTLLTTASRATGLTLPKPKSGLEELEYEEEHDEDEEDEDTEDDSEEEDSQEDETEAPVLAATPPAYSRVPHPPLWVQRNHGLVRSWVEKIRDEAGYVSGMLAPVGIGIAGALFILGVLYSIRAAHRKRRNTIKQQRRKQREMTSRQDQAMLLADSSEDEL